LSLLGVIRLAPWSLFENPKIAHDSFGTVTGYEVLKDFVVTLDPTNEDFS
jgi:hypothetical protein